MFGWSSLLSYLKRARFALVAFLLPFGIRAIPEIASGQYPVGWDTISFYVPSTLDWAAGKDSLLFMLGEAPLIYAISVPAKLLSVDPVMTFKVMGPMLYGTLCLSLFKYLRMTLDWNGRRSLEGSLLASLYFVTLRISWDLYRTMLGLTFTLLALAFLDGARTWKRHSAVAILVCLSVLSDQFTAVIVLFILGYRGIIALARRKRETTLTTFKVLVPGLLVFTLMAFGELATTGVPFPRQPLLQESWNILEGLNFLIFAFFPLIPLAILGIMELGKKDLQAWIFLCFGGALAAAMPGFGFAETGYRWVLLLSIPFCIYALPGLSAFAKIGRTFSGLPKMVVRNVPKIFAIGLIVSTGLYIFLPAQVAAPYYSLYPSFVPSSMMQSTVPLSDEGSLVRLLGWLGSNIGPGTALITHQAFYGWAREYFSQPNSVVNYGYAGPLTGVEEAKSKGYLTVVLIWWNNGQGWFGQMGVPSGFSPVRMDGNLAIFDYSARV